ncbi:MAG: YeiH family putative sulfate export transporter [Rivularia sp. (in: Bacteria)]|nr:YeiH family putative sulfate export transporter [Rivularia sp. MS3]
MKQFHKSKHLSPTRRNRNNRQWIQQLGAGLTLTSGLALLATFLHTLPGLGLFSPLILAILLGILVRNTVGTPQVCQLGITFSLKRILKFAIILLGLQLSLEQVIEVGGVGLSIVTLSLLATFVFTCWLGKRLGVDRKLSQLIAAGASICGASAVIATNVVVDGHDEDVAYAVAMVTVFGTASMLLYPLLPGLLHLTPQAFGLWCGASIHEVAQVIAAAFQDGKVSGEIATISKLSRVMLLAPMVLGLGLISARTNQKGRKLNLRQMPIPWFVLYFLGVIILNSLNIFPAGAKAAVIQINQFLLAISLAAMGLETSLLKLKQAGIKPLYLGAASWLFISVFSLGLIKIFYW